MQSQDLGEGQRVRMGKRDTGLNYLHQALEIFQQNEDPYSTSDACRIIARCFREMNQVDSSIYYAKKGLTKAGSIGYKTSILDASKLLAEVYESTDIKEALYYRKVFDSTNDVLYGPNKVKSLQKTLSDEQDRQRTSEAQRIAFQNRVRQYGLLGGLGIVLLLAFVFYRNNLQKKRANRVLENTLSNLRSAQSQLIQAEKWPRWVNLQQALRMRYRTR